MNNVLEKLNMVLVNHKLLKWEWIGGVLNTPNRKSQRSQLYKTDLIYITICMMLDFLINIINKMIKNNSQKQFKINRKKYLKIVKFFHHQNQHKTILPKSQKSIPNKQKFIPLTINSFFLSPKSTNINQNQIKPLFKYHTLLDANMTLLNVSKIQNFQIQQHYKNNVFHQSSYMKMQDSSIRTLNGPTKIYKKIDNYQSRPKSQYYKKKLLGEQLVDSESPVAFTNSFLISKLEKARKDKSTFYKIRKNKYNNNENQSKFEQ